MVGSSKRATEKVKGTVQELEAAITAVKDGHRLKSEAQ
jgi:hypothetical protein